MSDEKHHLYVSETTKMWQKHDWSHAFLRFRFKAGIVDIVIREFFLIHLKFKHRNHHFRYSFVKLNAE